MAQMRGVTLYLISHDGFFIFLNKALPVKHACCTLQIQLKWLPNIQEKIKYGSFKCHLRTSHLGNEADLRTLEQARHAPNNTQVMQYLLELHTVH